MHAKRDRPVFIRIALTAVAMIVALFPVLMLVLLGEVFLILGLITVPIIGGYAYARSGLAADRRRSALRPAIAVASLWLFVSVALFSLLMAVIALFGDDLGETDSDSVFLTPDGMLFLAQVAGLFALQFVVTGLLGGVGGLVDFALRKGEQSRVDSVPKPAGLERYDPWR